MIVSLRGGIRLTAGLCYSDYFLCSFSLSGLYREDGPHRLVFIERLVDDHTELGTSYYELLTHIARQLNKLFFALNY